uniref:Uncharacterized protein n=1 Tax=Grammatophora oceanica TaxID=210454 RepID=A0A7S1VM99_9STRA
MASTTLDPVAWVQLFSAPARVIRAPVSTSHSSSSSPIGILLRLLLLLKQCQQEARGGRRRRGARAKSEVRKKEVLRITPVQYNTLLCSPTLGSQKEAHY